MSKKGASSKEAPFVLKPLTEAQRNKLLLKATLWMKLHNTDKSCREVEKLVEHKTCEELNCKHITLCKKSAEVAIQFFSEFSLPSVHPSYCFGWMYPEVERLDK